MVTMNLAVAPAPTPAERMTLQKKIVIIAAPDGAGKTTSARKSLRNEGDFRCSSVPV